MKAAWYEQFGAARDVLQVGEFATPVAGPGEVLVRLHASGINPSDVKKRAGSFPDLLEDGPVIPNSDGAGIIEAAGKGVKDRIPGERVWVYQAQFERRFGTAAEYVAVDATRAPRLPDETSFEIGACLGIPAMTAHRAVFADGDVGGQSILVTGGAGRVGHYAVQLAAQAGATVIATASNESDAAECRAAGAGAVVNHRDDQFAAAVLDANDGKPVDRIVEVEFGANLQTALDVLRVGGVVATYSSTAVAEPTVPFFRALYKDMTVRFIIVYAMPEPAKQAAIADIENALRNNRLQHRVARTLALDGIAEGNELIEQGSIRGCVVLEID